jgi:AraC-like DNA-binding protein
MAYKEFIPGEALRQYVKCYYIYESDTSDVFEDRAFATGCIEVMFNLGNGTWQTARNNEFVTTPAVELWGQVIRPLAFRSLGKNIMLGIRFYPHTASLFLNDDVALFNDHVSDFTDVSGKSVRMLHARLLETGLPDQQLELVEEFLLKRLSLFEKRFKWLPVMDSVMAELKQDDFFDNIENVASRYGISSRYLQKLFLQYTGLTPKLYHKINRFQKSLVLVSKKNMPLTSIAYDCGYFDQSHFIRDFKSFTGFLPSAGIIENSSAILASPNK